MKVAMLVLAGLLSLLTVIQEPDAFFGSGVESVHWLQSPRDVAAIEHITNPSDHPAGDPGRVQVADEKTGHVGAADAQAPVAMLLLIGLFAFAFTRISCFRQR